MFDVMCSPAFVEAPGIISWVLAIYLFHKAVQSAEKHGNILVIVSLLYLLTRQKLFKAAYITDKYNMW